jgi:hypothetical protein
MARTPNALREWRTERIEMLKTTTEFQSLGPGPKRLVLHMIRRSDNPDGSGMFVKQASYAKSLGVTRKTINEWLRKIVSERVFLPPEVRYRGAGTKGGRSTNVYRLNPALLAPRVTRPVTQPVTQRVTAEALRAEEALRAREPLFERNGSILTEAGEPSFGRDLREGLSNRPSSLRLEDRGEPQTLIGSSAQKVISSRERDQREYDDAYAETDLDAETFDREWLREHPETDVRLWSGIAAHALGVAHHDDSTREVLST